MLMKVMLQSTTERDPVEQGKALVDYVYVEAVSGDDAVAKASRPNWLVRGVEPAPTDYKIEQVAPAKRARKAA